ncbi:hypothetical protein ABZ915_35310 [Streptomyces sp. NPDC046915]|uniref:hypothetical protein n=1 Tax=Streptomyces sp. NPDC046915 TaxID=3155257 RepID=UPI0033C0E0A3
MLALRLTRLAHPAVQLRRLLVATAAAGTGFLLLGTFGYALGHQGAPAASLLLRLAWCAVPLAATVHFAVAVARTDPGTRPRPGLSALGLGPARLMAISALTTALSCTLGSAVALLLFLHLRGDVTGMPFDGAAARSLAAGRPLPVPATLTLLAVVPAIASTAAALVLRPRDIRRPRPVSPRFGARFRLREQTPAGGARQAPDEVTDPGAETPDADWTDVLTDPPPPREAPRGLPWGIAVLAAGLAVESYAGPAAPAPLRESPAGVLAGWALTAAGLVLAGPGLTHLCGLLLQAVRPGALRLLAGRVLMAEATRVGRPLGIVCAVASGAYAMTAPYAGGAPSFGPLTGLGTLLVAGCTVATLLTAAVEARQSRAGTTAALVRLGARATLLRGAAALRAGALLALFGPLTLAVAHLAALPLGR